MTSSAEVPSGPAPLHSDEDKRLALLRELNLPAPAMTSALDAIARMARRQTGCTIGAVCVIDAQWHKVLSASGAEPIDQPRSKSFCETTIAQTDLLEITDAIGDTRWAGTAASQQASSLRFYAGVAIRVEGLAVGTVCVFDTQARRLEGAQRDALHDLAALAATVFHERLREMRVYAHDELMRAASRAGSDWLWETDADGVLTWVSDSVEAHTGWPASAEIGMHSMKLNRPPKLPEARASWDRYRAARAAREPFRDGIAERDSAHGPILVAMSGKPFFDADGVYRGYRGAARDVTAEVNEREQVQRLQSLLQQAIEAINAGVMISGPDGRVLIGNAAWRRDLAPYSTGGYERWEDIIRAMVDAGLYPAAVGREDEFVAWRLSLPSLDAKPQEFQLRDGSFLVTDQLLPDGSVIHLSLNVTELRRAEREVERQRADALASQARMEAVLRAVPDLWIVFDADNRYLYCSDDRHPWLAQPFDRMRGRLIGEIVPPPVAELCVDAIERARSSGEVQHIEYQLDTLGSQRRSFEARLSPMPGRQVLLLTRDVTERLRAALSLAEAEERWKFAIEGAGDGVWDLDLDKNQAFMSPIWKAMIGFEVEPETGPSLNQWVACIHPDDRDRVLEAMWRYRRGSISDYRIEYRVRHKEGHWIWVLDRGKIVERRADGEPLRIVGTHTDITRLKLAEQALRDKQATELASRAKSEFLSRMSHEMRTPLNAVIGFAQLLRLQPDNSAEKVAEYTDHVLRAAEHLLGLVNEVLDLQRFEDGRATLTTEPVELAPFIDATLELLRPMAHGSSVALNNQVPPGIWAQADPRGLRQVLVNLCSNAIKYNRPNGWVCIGLLDAAQGRVALAIEDTGSGLTDTQITRLFQPFERLGHETSGIEGSGLGLLIARTLVIEMGGELTLSSIKDAGTLARVELPAASAQATDVSITPASVPEPAAATSAQSPLRVLYVEDNRINALLFEEAMRVLGGFDLKVAEDGAQALALVAQWTPQVLVLDAHLPDMTGFEVLQRLRELPALAQVPAYMCSADAMAEDLQRARDAGFTGYWTKPIEVAVVSADLDALRQTANP